MPKTAISKELISFLCWMTFYPEIIENTKPKENFREKYKETNISIDMWKFRDLLRNKFTPQTRITLQNPRMTYL